jgi:hypothetical protein
MPRQPTLNAHCHPAHGKVLLEGADGVNAVVDDGGDQRGGGMPFGKRVVEVFGRACPPEAITGTDTASATWRVRVSS